MLNIGISWVPDKNVNDTLVNELMEDTIKSNHFTNYGPNVQRLEKETKRILGIVDKSVICVNNGSAALHALCAAIEYEEGRIIKWATQSFTFPPSAQGFLSDAVILDIDEGGGLDLEMVADDIDGIIVTNIFGNVVNIDKYVKWAEENNKFLVFDNAATSCSTYKGINVNNYGTGCTVSYHHTKPIGFGEGGAVIVKSKYETAVRRIINFGLDNAQPSCKWSRSASNYKMSDIAAVYILQYLVNVPDIIDVHTKLYEHMKNRLEDIDTIKLYPNFGEPILSCFSLIFENYDDDIRLKLREKDIFCRKYYKPLADMPVSKIVYDSILCVPCTVDMTIEDVDNMLNIIIK